MSRRPVGPFLCSMALAALALWAATAPAQTDKEFEVRMSNGDTRGVDILEYGAGAFTLNGATVPPDQVDSFRIDAAALREEAAKREAELDALRAQVDDLKKKLEARAEWTAPNLDVKTPDNEALLHEERKVVEDLKEEKRALEERLKTAQRETNDHKSQVSQREKRILDLEKDIQRLESQQREAESQRKKLAAQTFSFEETQKARFSRSRTDGLVNVMGRIRNTSLASFSLVVVEVSARASDGRTEDKNSTVLGVFEPGKSYDYKCDLEIQFSERHGLTLHVDAWPAVVK